MLKNFWDKNKKSQILFFSIIVLWSVVLTYISRYVINGPDSFDHKFHLIRIVGLAQSIHYGDYLPSLNNIFSWGTGYASSLFYGNWQLYIPAITFLYTKNAILSYSSLAFLVILFTSTSSYFFFNKILKDNIKSFWIACAMPCVFSFYGFGMTMAVCFVPMLVYSIYKVIYEDKSNPLLLAVTISLLIQTHILSTLVLAIVSVVFLLFSINHLKVKHIISFIISAIIGLLLSSGFILQYAEQVKSQVFYFEWKNRDFPVDNKVMFDLSKNFHSGFSSLANFYELPLQLVVIYLFSRFRNLKNISKVLLLVSLSMYLMMTPLLPWSTYLRYTILGSLQYTERLSFFTPMLILLIVGIEAEIKTVRGVALAVITMYFFGVVNNEENLASPSMTNYLNKNYIEMPKVFDNPMSIFMSTVGDEYYSIDINHSEIGDKKFANISNENNVTIENINYGYNKIQIDYNISNPNKIASMVVPKIYYKGYVAKYSNGGEGTQPLLEKRKMSNNEMIEAAKLKKPKTKFKILNNGKIYLQLRKSGRVLVEYKKTKMQYIGYIIEIISLSSILLYLVFSKKNK